MQYCRNCGTKQLNGTMFCSNCGATLEDEELLKKGPTVSLEQEQTQELVYTPTVQKPGSQSPTRICLTIATTGRRIEIEHGQQLTIGRKDVNTGATPDIDLTDDGGYEGGISRQHAIITFSDNTCTIEDMESYNGTFINGRELTPYRATTLHNKDTLSIGRLVLRVEFETP